MLQRTLRRGSQNVSRTGSSRFAFICQHPLTWQTSVPTQPVSLAQVSSRPRTDYAGKITRDQGSLTQRRDDKETSARDVYISRWTKTLDPLLPPQYRMNVKSGPFANFYQPDALLIAENLLEAHKLSAHLPTDIRLTSDLLYVFAVDQGRWRLVVWLVKMLLEGLRVEDVHAERLSATVQKWHREGSLDELTAEPLYSKPDEGGASAEAHLETSRGRSLEEATATYAPEDLSQSERLAHDTLGLIWRALGSLTVKCATDHGIAGGAMKSEVLEMIALVHHHGFMPASTYSYTPSDSPDAIQQPPTLHLLSSKIMTALSDAAWQAQATTTLKPSNRQPASGSRLLNHGLFSKLQGEGIKPEIWLELILWACLHGGWVSQGTTVMSHVCSMEGESQWLPLSWRDGLDKVAPFGQSKYIDWSSLRYVYETTSTADRDSSQATGLRIDRTISSEVVNAYLDAIVSNIHVGVGSRGSSLAFVMINLHDFRAFLQRADLNLVGGTWDALLIRLVESNGIDVETNPHLVRELVAESPGIGQELASRTSQPLPSYVLDGSAAILGLLHRALRTSIRQSKLQTAITMFKVLQERVDDERRRSLTDFFQSKVLSDASSKELFTSNFAGIDYPAFDTQIPANLLASLLELVTEQRKFDFGLWMLTNNDIDGPAIPERMYGEPSISAAVVRFAVMSGRIDLLDKIVQVQSQKRKSSDAQYRLPQAVFAGFLDAQIELRNWDTVERMLGYVREAEEYDWTISSAAELIRVMLVESIAIDSEAPDSGFARARKIFVDLAKGRYDKAMRSRTKTLENQVDALLLTLSSLGPQWSDTSAEGRILPRVLQVYEMPIRVFARVLDGAAASQGVDAAMSLVDTFCLAPFDDDPRSADPLSSDFSTTGVTRMPRYYREGAQSTKRLRKAIQLPGASGRRIVVYLTWRPNASVFRVILRHALKDYTALHGSHVSPQKESVETGDLPFVSKVNASGEDDARPSVPDRLSVFEWILRSMKRLHLNPEEVRGAIEAALRPEDFAVVERAVELSGMGGLQALETLAQDFSAGHQSGEGLKTASTTLST
ncbi:hypothetical protein B0A48_03752 [Cryoendolithus antarcticus]|uniref:Uncharacterized protein n=1 Tax=Cryoendolithus antarcticus TaxID=1507870 RepID=A0A1V8TGF4_9PEZI|nr:hypothetical protein B0A48_03752 [Cryoendolithus antarcticus]